MTNMVSEKLPSGAFPRDGLLASTGFVHMRVSDTRSWASTAI
jgi:hypothetical protein